MAHYYKVYRTDDGNAAVYESSDAALRGQEVAVFPDRVNADYKGDTVAEFFAQILDEPPPPRGSVRWSDAQALAGYALEIAPDVRLEYGFKPRSTVVPAQQPAAPPSPSINATDLDPHAIVKTIDTRVPPVMEQPVSPLDQLSDRARSLAAGLEELDTLSTELGANYLADHLERLSGDLVKHFDELAGMLQLNPSTPQAQNLQVAIQRLQQTATRSQARRMLRMPQLRS